MSKRVSVRCGDGGKVSKRVSVRCGDGGKVSKRVSVRCGGGTSQFLFEVYDSRIKTTKQKYLLCLVTETIRSRIFFSNTLS